MKSILKIERVALDKLVIIGLMITVMLTGDLIPSELSVIVVFLLLLLLVIRFHRINLREIVIVLPLFLMLILGIITSIFQNRLSAGANLYLVGKDIWYFIKPIIYLLAGFYIFRMRFQKETFFAILLNVSLFLSVLHIIKVIVFLLTAAPDDLLLEAIRFQTGPGNLMESYSLAYILILFRSGEMKKYILFPRWLYIGIYSVSIILSLSRTVFISFIISLLALINFFSFRLNILIKSVIRVVLITLLAFLFLLYLNAASDKDSLLHSLTTKYLNTLKEMSYKKKYLTFEEINRNWRGIETHLANEEFRRGSSTEKILGCGFGKTVFLGDFQGFLGDDNINIPKFHNGFIEILLKTGYTGIVLYCLFFFFAFKVADRDSKKRDTDLLLKAIIVTSFFTTLVITGLYNKSALDPSCLLMGYLLGYSFERKSDQA